jgi:electron transport complex protein RnfG
MASKMKSSFVNMVVVLGLVAAVSGTSLGYMYEITKAPIAKAQAEKLKNAIAMVAPEFEEVNEFKVAPADNIGDSLTFYEVTKGGTVVGTAVKSWTDKGFSGRLWAIVAFLPDGSINNSNVLEHKETPGLGDKTDIAKSTWNEQFKGKNPADYKLIVTKDGGDVDAITAATISSRAYCDAMQRAYNAYMKHAQSNTSEVIVEELDIPDTTEVADTIQETTNIGGNE